MANQPQVYQRNLPARKEGPPPERVFFWGMGIVAVGGALYFAREYFRDKQNGGSNGETYYDPYSPNTNTGSGSGSKTSSVKKSSFPLKNGSSGTLVTQLQQGLQRILGSTAFAKFTAIDGKFGPGTESALRAAGYATTVDEGTFKQITSSTGSGTGSGGTTIPSILGTPRAFAMDLYSQASNRNISRVLLLLRQMKTTADYSMISKEYQDITDSYTFVRKTIVTHLLDEAFVSDPVAKSQIKDEFLRMGLKLDGSTGRWSLSGLGLLRLKDIVAFQDTFAVDRGGNRFPVKRGTILGEAVYEANGYTFFQTIDHFVFATPSVSVRQA